MASLVSAHVTKAVCIAIMRGVNMRELSFSQLWPKLAQPQCTTFRFSRKDRDWQVGEVVKVLYKARSPKDRSVLGQAVITKKEQRWIWTTQSPHESPTLCRLVTEQEAQADGFIDRDDMVNFVNGQGDRVWYEPMNKLTLAWTQYWLYVPEQKPHIQKEWAAVLSKSLFTEVFNYIKIPGTKTAKYILHEAELERITNQAALGSKCL